jgi:hypothetical protein
VPRRASGAAIYADLAPIIVKTPLPSSAEVLIQAQIRLAQRLQLTTSSDALSGITFNLQQRNS